MPRRPLKRARCPEILSHGCAVVFFKDETFVICGAIFETCKEIGCGVLDATSLKLGLLINFEVTQKYK